ncbi:glycosyltransferase family 4 protein [bacterium]|nr:glycosyltransferase family 4 protein [bacterium]
MTTPLKVGIIGPCPPPHGGVTRILENHLRYWEEYPLVTWLMATETHEKHEAYPQTQLIEQPKAVSLFEFIEAVLRVGWRFGLCRWRTFKRVIEYDIAVKNAIKKHQFDIIYAHHTADTGLIAVTEARRAGIPSVVTAYGETQLVQASSRRWKRAIEYTVTHADWLVSTSDHCRRGAITRGATEERTSVIYAGIDLERFRPGLDGSVFCRSIGVPENAIVISILGLALRRKLDTFLDALQSLLDIPDVYVLIGGTGQDRKYLEERIQSIPGGRVKALGFVPEKDLPEFYAATDILVVAPNTVVECMGQSMKEAMACGRAVVGARLGGVPEALEASKCGLMFEPDNPADLNRALKLLISDPNMRESLGRNGRVEAEKRFDAKVSAQQMYELLQARYEANRDLTRA